MLDIPNDIRSLSDFKRNTSELLERLKKTGNPLVLTINGKAELVVQDAKAYEDLLDRVQTIESIQRGRADVKAGHTSPARKAFDRLDGSMAYRVELKRIRSGALVDAGRESRRPTYRNVMARQQPRRHPLHLGVDPPS